MTQAAAIYARVSSDRRRRNTQLRVRQQLCWSTRRSTATSYRRNGYFKTKAIAALP